VRPSDLYPDNQPQGNIWVRVVNDGPTTLSNKKVRIGGSYTRSTLTSPPTASGANIAPADYTINLAPGQQQNINLGWQIDLTQYNYDFTVTVTAVDFTDPNTGNNSYKESFAGTPAPFVPRWGQCSWVGVESAGINSHQPVTWCSNGSFVTGLDLDRQAIDPLDSPVVGQAHCCPLAVGQFSNWGACSWVGVETAGINSHQAVAWCPDGSYITGLDLDRQAIDPLDSPVVGQVQCCPMVAAQYSKWNSCSWVGVEKAGINSHQPVTWCPNGSFLAGFDLDRQAIDPLDSPVVGQALCCRP
jgi:hypothetical protein